MNGIPTSEESSPKTIRITLIMKTAFLGEDKFIKILHEIKIWRIPHLILIVIHAFNYDQEINSR
jgi:hypothetical protein